MLRGDDDESSSADGKDASTAALDRLRLPRCGERG